jgi:hypothetical protein
MQIENEIKNIVILFFTDFEETQDDQFGYVTEKIDKIKALKEGEAWIAFNMMHALVRKRLFYILSKEAQEYLLKNEVEIPD